MTAMREIHAPPPRPLPVFVLADVSGSMSADGKIDALNLAMRDLIASLAEEQDARGIVQVGIITFGQESARLHVPLAPAGSVRWTDVIPQGRTPMGAAFTLLREMLEDEAVVPRRAFQPSLVLVSDGIPTDDWQGPLDALNRSDRSSRAMRMAMAIGADADEALLKEFVGNHGPDLFHAEDARQIRRFFRWVTMSIMARSRSVNPNADPGVAVDDDIDL
jgi:uncharacterized protein YegL